MTPLPSVGTRFALGSHLGTIRFAGTVGSTAGLWLGVEWDDPARGKHGGEKDGIQYFSCRIPNSGSFIRPTATGIAFGVSFLDALRGKYIEAHHGSETKEKIVLGSSNGAIQVEAVRLDKIRDKFSNVGRLAEVSLDGELVATCDASGEIGRTCPNIRGLNLTQNLIPSWDIVAAITTELPSLARLALNRNRLCMPLAWDKMMMAFQNLTDLQLSDTLTTWSEVTDIIAAMPKLHALECGYNYLTQLRREGVRTSPISQLTSINLDGNLLASWVDVYHALTAHKHLDRLILSSNVIANIPFPSPEQERMEHIQYLSLSNNRIATWGDLDALNMWCPQLQSLALVGNPLTDNNVQFSKSRQFAIALIPSLIILDGSQISKKERADCELFYLSYLSRHESIEERCKHRQWARLCEKHGTPGELGGQSLDHTKLASKLFELTVFHCLTPPLSTTEISSTETMHIRVLPSMKLRSLKLKLCKHLRLKASDVEVKLWIGMKDASVIQLGENEDNNDLDWLGIDSQSLMFFCIQ